MAESNLNKYDKVLKDIFYIHREKYPYYVRTESGFVGVDRFHVIMMMKQRGVKVEELDDLFCVLVYKKSRPLYRDKSIEEIQELLEKEYQEIDS